MEVRCCCDAGKLLGTIPQEFTFRGLFKIEGINGKQITVEVDACSLGRRKFLAVKSNDKPIEYFEQIEGWMPNTSLVSRVK